MRLINQIADINRDYKDNEIMNVAWIRFEDNVEVILTRYKGNDIL